MNEALIWGSSWRAWLATIAAGIVLYGLFLFLVFCLLKAAKRGDDMTPRMRDDAQEGINDD